MASNAPMSRASCATTDASEDCLAEGIDGSPHANSSRQRLHQAAVARQFPRRPHRGAAHPPPAIPAQAPSWALAGGRLPHSPGADSACGLAACSWCCERERGSHAAHRIAVEWTDAGGIEREGVFIPRHDTDSLLNRVAGGRLFPGEHHPARFSVLDIGGHIELSIRSHDGTVSVRVVGDNADALPASSCFSSVAEASAFFEGGSLGYSVTRDADRLDGLLLRTLDWRIRPLSVAEVHSSFFADQKRFPKGSIEFDHALVMRDILHEWHKAEDLYGIPRAA